ncbi:GNAT family N-acetyltransferase [Streptomyces sp. NBC_00237]|uniref:GNAT family N-acetyltransferase n=1 Tax=Streptomyces sp. NBC_00237 TaxID=2975687 RepID=UPI00225887A9|nr:GNAT family N-acetyltransferase [Streptomyces sp. NBC_00237]MCX5205047.1 GNAT family N-acetyltransferase [Streptomyces sp. NBC_00237]
MTVIPSHLTLRPTADVPLEALVRLVRSYEERLTGEARCTADAVQRETGHPGYDAHHNSWCLTGPDGEAVAWAGLTVRGVDSVDCALTVLPGPHAQDAAGALLARLGERVAGLERERGTPLTVTFGGIFEGDEAAVNALERAGFRRESSQYTWDVDLGAEPIPVRLPRNGVVRPLTATDLPALHALHLRHRGGTFKTADYEAFRRRVEAVCAAAQRDAAVALVLEVAGQPTGYVLVRTEDGDAQFLDTSVAPSARGTGVGLALVLSATAALRELGCRRATLALTSADPVEQQGLRGLLAVTRELAVLRFARQPGGPA